MIYIAICDDNEEDIYLIKELIIEYMNNSHILYKICSYPSGEALLESDDEPDILFLDIAMKGMNGIETGKKFRSRFHHTAIIYITSFPQYLVQAINSIHAFAYLEKPVHKEDLSAQMDDVLCNLKQEHAERKTVRFRITKVKDGNHVSKEFMDFDISDIYYFACVNRKIMIKTGWGEFFFYQKMKDVIERMKKYNFESCHQSFLVNLQYVRKMKGYDLWLSNGEKIPVSQKKSAEFREKMNIFVHNGIWEK